MARDPSVQGEQGPSDDTIWTTPSSTGNFAPNDKVRVYDAFGIAAFVKDPMIAIGDNITTLKWAAKDAVTPKNKHIQPIYHWL